jgi:GTPase
MEAAAENFRQLGIRNVYSVSAEHGGGVAELLDAVLAGRVKEDTAEGAEEPESEEADAADEAEPAESPEALRETKVAIIGRPNVGKSTLLNQLTGSARAIVSPVPGTTRDAVDERIEHDGRVYRLIDTAGIRRKGKTKLMAEKLSVVMARKHLEAADVALLVVDAMDGVTAVDAHIAGYAHESGRSLIVLINKWDLAGPERADGRRPADRELYEKQVRAALKFMPYAPILFISATSGKYTADIFSTLATVAAERRKRISTGEMNRFLKRVDFDRAGVPVSKRIKIYYLTQAQVAPPTFVLFTDRAVKLHFSYQRFLENQIRKAFGFVGTPIWIKNRARE